MKLIHLAFIIIALSLTALGQSLPKPKLKLFGLSDGVNNGVAVKVYEIEVVNRTEMSDEFFYLCPSLASVRYERRRVAHLDQSV